MTSAVAITRTQDAGSSTESERPLLTDGQCQRLGITLADAADAAEWARNYGPLTDEQRDRLRAVLDPYVKGVHPPCHNIGNTEHH